MGNLQINFFAVVVAAIAAFALGALWYSPVLFAKVWMEAHGYSEATLEQMKKTASRAYAISFVCYLVMATVMAVLIDMIGIQRVVGGVKLGVLCWVGFAATIGMTANAYSDKRFSVYLIDAGYQLVYLALMGGILAFWR